MNILIVSQYFFPENFRINDLSQKLQEKGHDVSVLTGMPNYPTGKVYSGYSWWRDMRREENGIEIFRVPIFLRRQSKGWQLAINYLSYVVSACLLGPFLLRGKKFDIVFSTNYSPATVGIPGILMKRIKRAPMLFWVQDLWPQSLSATGAVSSPRVLNMVGAMMTWIYRHCDLIMVQSQAFVEPIIALKAHPERIRYFPNWAEDLYTPVEIPENSEYAAELPAEGFIIMFAGNLGEAQSLETIIDAAEKVRDYSIHWVILGNGRRFDWMQNQIKQKNLQQSVHLLGGRPMDAMPYYFSLADALLVTLRPDPIFAATIPGKIQSYLACARPVIGALDGEGAKVINESESGFAVAAGDVDGLSSAVIKLSQMSVEAQKKLGQNALEFYKKYFDSQVLIENLEAEMTQLLKDPQ